MRTAYIGDNKEVYDRNRGLINLIKEDSSQLTITSYKCKVTDRFRIVNQE